MTQRRKLTEAQAISEFASALADASWCLDLSGTRPAALHALSNRSACSDTFLYEYRDWASRNNVEASKSAAFYKNLSSRVSARLPRIYGSSFRPVDQKFIEASGLRLANTYVPFKPALSDDVNGRVLLGELFEGLFPDEFERTMVRQFLAHIIQKPLERPQWGLLIMGDGGTGKSRLVELVELALGSKHRWRENNYKLIDKQFSEVLPDNLIVTFDDAPGGTQTYELLKHAITKSFQEVEIKGQQRKISREVYARIVVLSNDDDPLPGIADDRRLFVPSRCVHRVSREETENFFAKFNDWIKQSHVPAFLYHYFCGVNLTGFNASKTVKTETLIALEGKSNPAQLSEAVEEFASKAKIFHRVEIVDHLRSRGMKPNPEELSKVLENAGYVERRRTHPCRSKRQLALWCSARAARAPTLTDAQRDRILQALE